MVDMGTPPVERRVLDDDCSDDELSAFVNFLESPDALVPPARRRDPHVEIAEGGARLVGHFLHPTKTVDRDNESGEGTAETWDGLALAKGKNAPPGKDKKNKKKKASDVPPATISQVLSFLPTTEDRTMLALGILFAIGNGLVFPGLAFLFANSFSDLSQASDGLDDTRVLVLQFVGIGFYGFFCAGLQNFFFLIVSHRASDNFKKQWFAALLRQDASFHDVHSVSGMATALSSASGKMKRGLGRKLGEGVQFGTCFLGGIVYAFYSSWRVALVILGLLPFVSGAAFLLMRINQSQTSTAQKVR
jgi:ATP-binding cassette subfamily B (MDR/TAP) protein 1